MADKASEQEPSIEEILASIRQIISDDDDKEPVEADVQQGVSEPVPKVEVFEPEPVVTKEQEKNIVFEPVEEDILELTQTVDDEPMQIDLQEHEEPKEVVMETKPSSFDNEILTESAKSATISSMAKLAGNMPITRHREFGNITLEDLVREMLQPMLKDWLSESLPPMVERMVQRELEKLARKAQDV